MVEQQPEPEIRTRSGYPVSESIRAFLICLGESGVSATARCFHYSADIICSGALQAWQKFCLEYAIDNIGTISPKIFLFLQESFKEVDAIQARLAQEQLYRDPDFQKKIGEIIFILRSCPKKTKQHFPKVHQSCHAPGWLASVRTASNHEAASKVFRPGQDAQEMLDAANEILKGVREGATGTVLFWIRWLFEEDSLIKKELSQGLSVVERGGALWPEKARHSVGFFLAAVAAETVKDLESRNLLNMRQELGAMLRMYIVPDKKLTSKRRLDLLCLVFQLLTEAPRWKTPAAPTLIKDTIGLQRAIIGTDHFFREVLAYDGPVGDVAKEAKRGGRKPTSTTLIGRPGSKADNARQKTSALDERLKYFDSIIMNYHGGTR